MTVEELTRIYNEANNITVKNPPLTTDRIFAAMLACYNHGYQAHKSKQLLSDSEQKGMLDNPYAIDQLMNYHDLIFTEGEAAGYPVGQWPPERWSELKSIGKTIVEKDPDCFDAEIKRRFMS